MRIIALLLLALALLGAPDGWAEEEKAAKQKSVTVEGTLIDMKCYAENPENTGNDHVTPKGKMPACAQVCAKMGIPVGVLDADGNVVVLLVPSLQLADYMAMQIRVEGPPLLDGGVMVPTKIEIKKGDKWKVVEIANMM